MQTSGLEKSTDLAEGDGSAESSRATVVVYTASYCGYCHAAEALLRGRSIPYDKIDVTRDPPRRKWLVKATGRWTVPQIFIQGRPVGGCDDLHELDRSGQLAKMLAAESSGP